MNFYDLLGIKETATEEEIKLAYRSTIKKYHPDRNKDKDAIKMTISLNEAKEILLDPIKRREYDDKLKSINESKHYSTNKQETYKEQTKEYKEEYKEAFVTRMQVFKDYIKRSIDNLYIKSVKIFLVIINYLFWKILQLLIQAIYYLIYILEEFIMYALGFCIIGATLALVFMNGEQTGILPFLPANVGMFILLLLVAVLIAFLPILFRSKASNMYAKIQNISDSIFLKILKYENAK